jgi:hypothetical protein
MKHTLIPVLFILLAFTVTSQCKKDKNEITQIVYGKSFGECLGYCIKEMNVSNDKIFIEESSWDTELTPMTCSGNISADEWQDLVNSVNIDEFFNLDEVIGCPDCTDGGAEWIEIKTGDSVHKVTFEYGNAPDAVNKYIEKLRAIFFLTWDQCYPG